MERGVDKEGLLRDWSRALKAREVREIGSGQRREGKRARWEYPGLDLLSPDTYI